MPSENFRTKRYGPAKDSTVNSGTDTTPYGPGVHGNDHPPLPAVPDFRDDTRASEVGGIRSWYKTINWPDRVDRAALERVRQSFLHPTVTSK